MGRPSRIQLQIDVSNNELSAVRVSGTSVPISTGLMAAPQI